MLTKWSSDNSQKRGTQDALRAAIALRKALKKYGKDKDSQRTKLVGIGITKGKCLSLDRRDVSFISDGESQ